MRITPYCEKHGITHNDIVKMLRKVGIRVSLQAVRQWASNSSDRPKYETAIALVELTKGEITMPDLGYPLRCA